MFWLAPLLFAFAAAVNSGSVLAQKRRRAYDRLGRWGWRAHIALLVVVWGAAVVAIVLVGRDWVVALPGWVRPIGIVTGVIASLTFAAALRELGVQSLFNGNFFRRGSYSAEGVYALLAHPMYDAYVLSLISLGLREANAAYFVLAAESALALNVVEARVEGVERPVGHRFRRR